MPGGCWQSEQQVLHHEEEEAAPPCALLPGAGTLHLPFPCKKRYFPCTMQISNYCESGIKL